MQNNDISVRIEVKHSRRGCATPFSRWALPGRIWVRGYALDGSRVYSHHVGYVDLRWRGPRSHFAQVLSVAQTRLLAEVESGATAVAMTLPNGVTL